MTDKQKALSRFEIIWQYKGDELEIQPCFAAKWVEEYQDIIRTALASDDVGVMLDNEAVAKTGWRRCDLWYEAEASAPSIRWGFLIREYRHRGWLEIARAYGDTPAAAIRNAMEKIL